MTTRSWAPYQTREPHALEEGPKVPVESNDKLSMHVEALEAMVQQLTATVQQVVVSVQQLISCAKQTELRPRHVVPLHYHPLRIPGEWFPQVDDPIREVPGRRDYGD